MMITLPTHICVTRLQWFDRVRTSTSMLLPASFPACSGQEFAGLPHRGRDKWLPYTVYPKKYAHGFVVLCFVVVMQSFIMNSHVVFIHIHQGCFAGTGAIVRLPQCQWSKPGGYGKISQCRTTTKHSKAKTVCIFRGIYCSRRHVHTFSFNDIYCILIQISLKFVVKGVINNMPAWIQEMVRRRTGDKPLSEPRMA